MVPQHILELSSCMTLTLSNASEDLSQSQKFADKPPQSPQPEGLATELEAPS